jgi:hypothetical protein
VRQALEGKDVKDLLLNVGSGGGAAPAAGGAAAGGDTAAAEAAPAEEKEEGTLHAICSHARILTIPQRRRSQMTTWASVCSTKRLLSTISSPFAFAGVFKTGQRSDHAYSHSCGGLVIGCL